MNQTADLPLIQLKSLYTPWRHIYIGVYHMNGAQSEPFEHLKIIDEDLFMRCQQTVKARSTKNLDGEPVVFRTDTRSLLTGIIFCGHCGCRLCYNHQHEERKLASGGTSVYDYETYRCYRKISSSRTCDGQSSYKATALNEAVEQQVKLFLSLVKFEREDFALDPDMTPESLMEEWNRQLKIKKGG